MAPGERGRDATSNSTPYYGKVNEVLTEAGLDGEVEELCSGYDKPTMGRPNLAPGVFFWSVLVDCMEGIDGERGLT